MKMMSDRPQCFDPALDARTNQLIPVRCMTCGAVLGRHQLAFEELMEQQKEIKVRNDPVTVQRLLAGVENREERVERLREHRARRKECVKRQQEEKMEFLDERGIRRLCCRAPFLTRPQPENQSEERL